MQQNGYDVDRMPVAQESDHDHDHVEFLTPEGYVNVEHGFHGDYSAIDAESGIRLATIAAATGGAPADLDASADDRAGEFIRGKVVFSVDEAAFYMNRGDVRPGATYDPANPDAYFTPNTGAQWRGAQGGVNGIFDASSKTNNGVGTLTELTYGFYETRADIIPAYSLLGARLNGFSAFTPEQRAAARQAVAEWDELIPVKFTETSAANADINFMNTTTGPAQASAFLPYNYGPAYEGIQGDIAVNPRQASNFQFLPGQYGLNTLVHELGHSLGLEHPGRYNFSPTFTATYANGADYYQDSRQYSIMSYWDSEETGAKSVDWGLLTYRYSATPMVHDIAAIQRIYGVDTTTRTGDTTYGFNSNAGKDAYDLTKNPTPVFTIWDAGGNDTIDLSGYSTPSVINLNPGEYSSAGGVFSETIPTLAEINARRAAAGLVPRTQATYDLYKSLFGYTNGLMTDNIGIAYGAVIENAIGGKGNDLLIGNGVANVLNGGDGFDTVSYQDATAGVTASMASLRGTGGDAAGDRYVSVEALSGSNFADALEGGNANDVMSGLGGNDTLTGGNGNDTLNGGDGVDQLSGGNADDQLNGGAGDDRLEGGNGNDLLDGGLGADVLLGGTGNDRLVGGGGADLLDGGTGDDVLVAGAGNSTLTGGAGADTFQFTAASGTSQITDFARGVDKLDLHLLDANSALSGAQAFTFSNAGSFSGVAGQLISYKLGSGFAVAGDVNGDGVADFVIQTKVQLGASDLILI